MSTLQIGLLGGLVIRVDGQIISGFKSRKAEALLVYLAYNPRPQTRDALASLLWYGSDPEQAGANLRKTLSDLRQQMGDFLAISRETIALKPPSDWSVDAAAFQHLLHTQPLTIPTLEQALALYQGDFLAGFLLRDSLAFDEWASLERERLRLLALDAFHQLVLHCLHQRHYDLGLSYANRWLNLDPLNENAHRLLMRLYSRHGQRNLALAHYATCRQILDTELGVAPTLATQALAERIRHAPVEPDPLTLTLTPLVGRGEVLAQISQMLENGRLITLMGPPGSGKTRLAQEVASIHCTDFRQGVQFVAAPGTDWPVALALTLGLNENASLNQMVATLRGRENLFILDNVPGKTGIIPLLTTLLQQNQTCKWLLITPTPTHLPGEQIVTLTGLPYPTPEITVNGDGSTFPAVQLFLRQAQRVQPDFALTATNQADVWRICQIVAGMPRDLELAAATVRAFTPRQIIRQLAQNQATPEPERATRALWNDAWVLLDAVGQRQMADLAPPWQTVFPRPTSPLAVRLLGRFRVEWQGQPFTGFKSRKAEALFAYLLCQARPQTRETLATMFWGESSQEQALANLRKLLTELPPVLADYLLITRQTVAFDPERTCWLDAAALHHWLSQPLPTTPPDELIALYQGDFLAEFRLPDSPEFENWAALERERLRHLFSRKLYQIAEGHLHRRQYEPGLGYARRLQQIEPLSEQVHRLVLLLLVRQGQMDEALAHHEVFRQRLQAQLGIQPTSETQALLERIRHSSRQPVYLPPLPPHFMGRERELALIHEQLDDPACRLLTITGPGGVGKTTLALAAAADRQVDYLQGVIFVSLVGVADTHDLIAALAAAFGFSFSGTHPPRQQLLNFLRQKELLLVLDNSETLSSPAHVGSLDLLLEILHQAPQVKILATSRERFNIPAEQVCPLPGLAVPDLTASLETVQGNEAVRLFTWRAQKSQPDFALTAATMADVVQICRLVQGVPLGLELAAAATAFYPVPRIATEIARNLDFLVHHTPEQADRHRSLRAVFTYSWQLLPAREREIFSQLSVFRGLFSLEAAQAVAGATQTDILSLIDKTMVRAEPGERYLVHELLRQYGGEKLADMPGAAATVNRRHAHYYLHLVQEQELALLGRDVRQAAQYLDGQMENIRLAWRWAVAQKDGAVLLAASPGLSRYCLVRGLFQEGERLFGAAAETLIAQPSLSLARYGFLSEQARFLNEQSRHDQAIPVAQQALEMWPTVSATPLPLLTTTPELELGRAQMRKGDYAAAHVYACQVLDQAQAWQSARLRVEGVRLQASIHIEQGELAEARPLFEQVREQYHTLDDLTHESVALHNLGVIHRRQGDFTTAEQYYQQTLVSRQATGYRQGMALTLNNLGAIALDRGQYTEAGAYNRQALQISREIGDRYVESMALVNVGIIAHDQGNYGEAQTDYEASLAVCREIGNRRLEGVLLNLYALLLTHRGQYAAALQVCEQMRQLAQGLGHQATVAYSWLNEGRVKAGMQVWPEATAAFLEACALWREDLPIFQLEPLAGLAHIALAQGEIALARARIEPILAFLQAGNELDGLYEPLWVYLTCYRVLQASGEGERGRDLLRTAYTILQDRAAKITDPAMRHSFLTNVAVHGEIGGEIERLGD